jgi:hypothetical protein
MLERLQTQLAKAKATIPDYRLGAAWCGYMGQIGVSGAGRVIESVRSVLKTVGSVLNADGFVLNSPGSVLVTVKNRFLRRRRS